LLMFATVVTAGAVIYQGSVLREQTDATKTSANAARSAAETADKTLKSMTISGDQTKKQIDRLIEQQQRTADSTVKAAESASASVTVASDGLTNNLDTFKKGNRAYIGVTDAFINGADPEKNIPERLRGGANIFDIEITNKGVTPARHIRSWGAARVVTRLFDTDNPIYPIPLESRTYKDGKDLISGVKDYLKPGGIINPPQLTLLLNLLAHRYFMAFGVTEYRDIFEQPHSTKFCVYFDITQNDIGYCPAHNTIE
ncbi:MAG: hypothetical protein WBE37_21295, partial [Bryobacteraceae bacterium]